MTENGTVDLPIDDLDPANLGTIDIPAGGYTPRLAPFPTPGISWAAWAEGTEPTQKIRQRYLAE